MKQIIEALLERITIAQIKHALNLSGNQWAQL
jgi:hypothetical protein